MRRIGNVNTALRDDVGHDGGAGDMRLRAVLYAGGAIATSAGLHTALAGARSVPPWRHASPMVESELRFYSAYYVAYGLALIRTARSTEPDPDAVRALAATLFLAGLARAGAWVATGRPHPAQQALLAIELAAPPLVVAQLARAGSAS
jgi:hypothetical protein